MTIYETPYGTVDAPTLEAAQKWIARQKASLPTQAEKRMPEPAQPEGGFLDRLWKGITGKDVSRAGRVGMGLADPFYGAAQLGARMGPEEGGAAFANPADLAARQKTVDTTVQQRQQQYQQARQAANPGQKLGTDWYRLLGNIGGSAPLAAATPGGAGAGLGTRLALGAAGGALGGSVAPVANPQNFGRQKLGQVALGAGAGGALGGAGQAVGGALAPRLSPDIAALRNANVPLTAGRVLGTPFQGMEQRLAGLPIIGDFIKNRERQSLEGFNRTTINQALEPIGASLPAKSAWGRESLKNMNTAIDKAYDAALDPISKVAGDADFGRSLAQLKTVAQKKPDVWSRFEPVWQEAVDSFSSDKTMTGRGVKQMMSELGRDARNYSRSDDYDKRELAARMNDLKSQLSALVQRQWPEEAGKLASADKSYAMAMRVGQAANRRAGSEGKFTPMDLLTASRSQGGGMRGKEFQQGDALFQQWGELANRILPSSIPDSGTAGRFIAAHPVTGTALGLGNLAGYVPMHLAGKAALRRSGTLPDPYRNALDQLSGITTPGFGTGVAR